MSVRFHSAPVGTPRRLSERARIHLVVPDRVPGVEPMVQRVTEVVGISKKGFADAAANAVETASRTVRGMKWFRASEFEGRVENGKVVEFHATVRIYFDYEGKE